MTGLKTSLNCRIPKEKIPLNLNSNYRPTEGEGKTAAVIFSGCSDTSLPFQLYQLLMCGLEDAVKKKSLPGTVERFDKANSGCLAGGEGSGSGKSAHMARNKEVTKIEHQKNLKRRKLMSKKSAAIKQPRPGGQQEII